MSMRILIPLAFLVLFIALISGCDDADVASYNVSKAASNFEVLRRVVFYNGITNTYMLVIEGYSSIYYDSTENQLEVTCKVGPKQYKKHFLGLSDNVTYFAEQISPQGVSSHHYRVTFKPSVILPAIDVR